jgi:hypothetical protein
MQKKYIQIRKLEKVGNHTETHQLAHQAITSIEQSNSDSLFSLQHKAGNQAVARLIKSHASSNDEEIHPRIQSLIAQSRNNGTPVDKDICDQASLSLGADFSHVRIHTDERANQLTHALDAAAFTTGRDIFFRKGQFNSRSAHGQTLLAHELTHVVQQGGQQDAPARKLGPENDQHEQQADQIGRSAQKRGTSLHIEIMEKKGYKSSTGGGVRPSLSNTISRPK